MLATVVNVIEQIINTQFVKFFFFPFDFEYIKISINEDTLEYKNPLFCTNIYKAYKATCISTIA